MQLSKEQLIRIRERMNEKKRKGKPKKRLTRKQKIELLKTRPKKPRTPKKFKPGGELNAGNVGSNL